MGKNFIILMMGFTATGKSTLATNLAKKLGASVFHSALTRKNLGLANFTKDEAKEEFFDLTKDDRKEMDMNVYSENCRLATEELRKGRDAIIDAGHFFRWQRQMVYRSVAGINPDIIIVRAVCSEKEALRRLDKRLEEFGKSVLNETPSVKTYYSCSKATEYPDEFDVLESGEKPAIIECDTEKKTVRLVQGEEKSGNIRKVIEAAKAVNL